MQIPLLNKEEIKIKGSRRIAELRINRLAEKKRKAATEAIKAKELIIKEKSAELKELIIEDKKELLTLQKTHRELFDEELRASLALAVDKRIDAKFSELIEAADKMKKHLNIIDGVGNGDKTNIMFLPGEIFEKFSKQSLPQTTTEGTATVITKE